MGSTASGESYNPEKLFKIDHQHAYSTARGLVFNNGLHVDLRGAGGRKLGGVDGQCLGKSHFW